MQTSGILSGSMIQSEVQRGRISITPYVEKHLNPNSYDLTLGDGVLVYRDAVWHPFLGPGVDGVDLEPAQLKRSILDAKEAPKTISMKIGPEGFVIKPGIGYLMHTAERVGTDHYVPILDGKSSIGRLFVKVHETAGYGDAGFHGQYTLEVTTVFPVRVYAGMRFCQIRFHTIAGEVSLYHGRYQGERAQGAIASRAWEQIQESNLK